jgi:hypothetical protein
MLIAKSGGFPNYKRLGLYVASAATIDASFADTIRKILAQRDGGMSARG